MKASEVSNRKIMGSKPAGNSHFFSFFRGSLNPQRKKRHGIGKLFSVDLLHSVSRLVGGRMKHVV